MVALVGALRFFDFGETWVVLLYTQCQACTMNVAHNLSSFIPQEDYIRGACESLIMFLLIVEILGQNIRMNDEIAGIEINRIVIKSGQSVC